MTISYKKENGYYVPNLALKSKKKGNIGKYGLLHLNHLKQHEKVLYQKLLAEDKLTNHLIEIDVLSTLRVGQLIKALAKIENVNEELKATDQMKWVKLMNNIKNQAEEIVLNEIIYN